MGKMALVWMMLVDCLLFGACAVPVDLDAEASEQADQMNSADATEAREDDRRGELELCRELAYDNEDTRAAFCRSQPRADVRGRCWAKYKGSPFAWLGWCKNEFSY
jgi:hypothetical protein